MDPESPLRVKIVRWGGIAGVPLTYEIDTTSLAPGRAHELRTLVDAAGLLEGALDVVERRFPEGRDLIEWEITATFGGTSRSVRCTEDALGPSLARLVAFVRG